MKQSRRKELKTNELSIYLQQIYDFLSRNVTYVVGAAVVVGLIIIVGTLNVRSQRRARADTAERLQLIQAGDVTPDAKLLDELKDMATDYGNDPGLGPEILGMQASLANQLALNLTTEADKPRRDQLLQEAKAACERQIRDFGNRPDIVARARLVMATVEETMYMDHKATLDQIRDLYKQIIDGPPNPYQELAKERLNTLAERTAPLKLVPAPPPPPPTPVATAPAPTTTRPSTSATGPARPATSNPAAAVPKRPGGGPTTGGTAKPTPAPAK
jgi:hypothetical protein